MSTCVSCVIAICMPVVCDCAPSKERCEKTAVQAKIMYGVHFSVWSLLIKVAFCLRSPFHTILHTDPVAVIA